MNLLSKQFSELTTYELYQIFKARNEVFVIEQHCIYPEIDEIDLNCTHVFTEPFAAYGRYYKHSKTSQVWSFGRVLVLKDKRNKGLALSLTKQIVSEIKSLDPQAEIQISAQAHLSQFYNKIGFKLMGEMYLEDGIPHCKMVLQPHDAG